MKTQDVTCRGRAPTEDEQRGMDWWNGLPEAERRFWLDIAWRRNETVAGRRCYSTEDLPSAADAWAAYKETLSG